MCSDASERAKLITDLYVKVKKEVERKVEKYKDKTHKGRKKVIFQPGDWVGYI